MDNYEYNILYQKMKTKTRSYKYQYVNEEYDIVNCRLKTRILDGMNVDWQNMMEKEMWRVGNRLGKDGKKLEPINRAFTCHKSCSRPATSLSLSYSHTSLYIKSWKFVPSQIQAWGRRKITLIPETFFVAICYLFRSYITYML